MPVPGNIYREYQIHGIVSVDFSGVGMHEVAGESLILIPNGELFAKNRAVTAIPYDSNPVLFTIRNPDMFFDDTKNVHKLENQVEDYLEANNLYALRRLTDTTYAFATLRGGIASWTKTGIGRGQTALHKQTIPFPITQVVILLHSRLLPYP